ncbi:MAG: PAS domain S-box protein [Saprospiraceae bacterium]
MIDTHEKKLNPRHFYNTIIDHAPDAIMVFDLDLRLVRLNDQACRQFGYEREVLLGRKASELNLEMAPTRMDDYFQALLEHRQVLLETSITRNGQHIQLEVKANLIELDGHTFIVAFSRDVSEHRQIEQKLVDERMLVNALMEHLPDIIFFKDLEGRWLRVSRKLLDDLHVSDMSEIIGKTDFDFYPEEFARHTRQDEQEIIRTGRPLIGKIEYRQLNMVGSVWTMVTKVPLKNSEGEIIGIAGISRDIDEIKEREEHLRIKENQLSIASQIAGLGYWEYHTEEGLFTFNDHFYQVLGTTARENGGYKMKPGTFAHRFVHPADRQQVIDEMKAAQINTQLDYPRQLEHRIIYPDGSIGHVAVSFFVVRDDQGVTLKTFGVSQNITDRKIAEKAIHESEAQLSMAAKIAKLGYWEFDSKERLFTFNDQFYTIFKTSASELGSYRISLDEYADKFLLPEEKPMVFTKIESAILHLKDKEHYYLEHRIRHGNGEIGYLAVRFFVIRDRSGELVKLIGVNQDITELKMAKQALQQTEAGLQKAFEVAVVGPYKLIFQENRIEWSAMALAVYGFNKDRIPATIKSYLTMVHPEDVWILQNAMKRKPGEDVSDLEHRILINGQIKWVRSRSHYEFDEYGTSLSAIGVVQDITAAKQAESELINYRQHLEHLVQQRTAQLEVINKDLEAFAYSISHDLRAPIRHINGFANLLSKRLFDPDDGKQELIQLINEASTRMGDMIDGLLNFSRLGRQKLDTTLIDLNQLVAEVIQYFAPDQLKRNIRWTVHPLPSVKGDYTLLKVVFENLISNAIKYTRNEKNTEIEINTFAADPKKRTIYIRDNGVGFDMDYANKLFGVFQRLHGTEEFEGTGIGLANALQIIKKHGGDIRAEGKVGEGATFYVSF